MQMMWFAKISEKSTNIQEAPNAARTVSYKAWNSTVDYPRRECKHGIKASIPKKTSKLSWIGLCEGKALVTDGFPSQRARNAESISMPYQKIEMKRIEEVMFFNIHDCNWSVL